MANCHEQCHLTDNTKMFIFVRRNVCYSALNNSFVWCQGDLAVTHPDGYIQIRDRSKDIIISGGENISSLEVEDVLYKHPEILEAAVVAKADEKWGEVPCAFVVKRDSDSVLSEDDVIQYCKSHLPRFMAPKLVSPMQSLSHQ